MISFDLEVTRVFQSVIISKFIEHAQESLPKVPFENHIIGFVDFCSRIQFTTCPFLYSDVQAEFYLVFSPSG